MLGLRHVDVVRRIAVQFCTQYISNCLVHAFADRIGLGILARRADILDLKDIEEPLEFASNELATLVVYTADRAWVT